MTSRPVWTSLTLKGNRESPPRGDCLFHFESEERSDEVAKWNRRTPPTVPLIVPLPCRSPPYHSRRGCGNREEMNFFACLVILTLLALPG